MNKERLLLAGSLALNLILLFLWLGGVAERERREESAETPSEIAAVTRGAAGVDEPMSEATTSTATFEPTATDSLPAAQVATATATPDAPPTEEPTVATTPTVASTPEPTNTPVPPTATAAPQPEWLNYLNGFREEANLPPLLENGAWSAGSLLHSIYMVKTDEIGHSERVASGWYSEEGYQAAVNGNIAATVWNGATAQRAQRAGRARRDCADSVPATCAGGVYGDHLREWGGDQVGVRGGGAAGVAAAGLKAAR